MQSGSFLCIQTYSSKRGCFSDVQWMLSLQPMKGSHWLVDSH